MRGSAGIYYARQNMLSQVGSVTTNGIQQKSDFRNSTFTAFADMPVWPNLLPPSAVPPGTFPLFTGVRVFDRDYRNPRIVSVNVGFEQEVAPSVAAYVDFTVREGHAPDAVPELQRARHGRRGQSSRRRATRRPTPAPIRSSRSWATSS